MSTCTLCLTQYRPQAQRLPMESALRDLRQLDLPFHGLRVLRIVRRWFTPRLAIVGAEYFGANREFVAAGDEVRRVKDIQRFGRGKYVAIGTSIRRVEIG